MGPHNGSRYYVSFIDDYTYYWIYYVSFIDGYTYYGVYIMKYRFDFLSIYNIFQTHVKTQHFVVVKCFKCDLGGEYTFNAFCELLVSHGTMHHIFCIDTLEQNGVIRRKYRHISKTVHVLLLSACVPIEVWGKVIFTTIHLINKIPLAYTFDLSSLKSCMSMFLITIP